MSRHRFHVATSFLPTVGFPGRDTTNPGRDLPHCHPCRDLKNDVATSNPTSQITTSNFQVATPKGHPTSLPQIHVVTPFLPNQNKRGRDTKFTVSSCDTKIPGRPAGDLLQPSQVATPLPSRDLTPNQTRSRPQIEVATSIGPNPQRPLFLWS